MTTPAECGCRLCREYGLTLTRPCPICGRENSVDEDGFCHNPACEDEV